MPLDCKSDVPSIFLPCSKGYKFSLFVSFENDALPDKILDEVKIKTCAKQPCFIFDADPNHN